MSTPRIGGTAAGNPAASITICKPATGTDTPDEVLAADA